MQVTPGLGVISVFLVFLLMKEPKRGLADGQRTAEGVRGKHGLAAYIKDLRDIAKK